MPDPITDIAGPEIQGELDGLRLLVEETEGNVIAFVRYERVTEREAGIRYLKEQLSTPVVERVLSEDRKNPLALLDNLSDERCCVQFYDLEAALPEVTGSLNLNREAYAEVPHALVFWVGEHGLREVATNAPDFWAWRSGVFDVRSDEPGLSQSMSQVALADDVQFKDRGDLERRVSIYEGLIEEYKGQKQEARYVAQLRLKLAGALHRLREFDESKQIAGKVRAWAEEKGYPDLAAPAYHQLGMAAQGKRDFEEAEEWYERAVKTLNRLGDSQRVAIAYHQLGIVAEEKRDFDEARNRYQKALEIFERLGDERRAAATYHEMGRVAHRRRNFEEAEKKYRAALDAKKRLGDEYGVAQTFHQLGVLAQDRQDFETAEVCYKKALKILKRSEDEYEIAKTHHGLGVVAQGRGDYGEAEDWYRKALELEERPNSEHIVAFTYYQFGCLARERGNLREAGSWLLKAVESFRSTNDEWGEQIAVRDFAVTLAQVTPDAQDDLRRQWIDAGLPEDELDDLLDQVRAEKSG